MQNAGTGFVRQAPGVYPPSFCSWRLMLAVCVVAQLAVLLAGIGRWRAIGPEWLLLTTVYAQSVGLISALSVCTFRSWLARKLISAGESVVYPKRRLERQKIVRTHSIPETCPHTLDLYNDSRRQLRARVVRLKSQPLSGGKAGMLKNLSAMIRTRRTPMPRASQQAVGLGRGWW